MRSETSARRAWAGVAFLLTSVLAEAALAHGPPPSVTRVVAADSQGPRVVGTTEGLALRRGDRFMYLCQSLFGDEAEAPAASAGGDEVFVAGTRDLYRLGADGRVSALGRPELTRSFVLRLIPSPGGRVLALRLENGTTDLRPLDGSPPVWSDASIYDSITPDGSALWLARSAGTEGHVIQLGDDGTTLRSLHVSLESGERISQVREMGGVLYLTLVEPSGGRVLTVDAAGDAGTMVVLESESQISGPVVAGSRAWLAADGILHRVHGARAEPVATAEHIASVLSAGDRAFVAFRTTLLEVGEEGPGAKVVDMVDFAPPDLELVPAALHDTCQSEWLVLRADLEWVGAIPAASPREGGTGAPVSGLRASGSGGGCGLGGGVPPAAGSMALGYLASALLARRATRRR